MDLWRLSKKDFYGDLYFFIPVEALLLGFCVAYSTWAIAALVVSGYIAWMVFEYALHRWAFHNHGWLQKDHWIHHTEPENFIGAPVWVSIVSFTVLGMILYLSLGVLFGAAIILGFVAGYLTYLYVHHRCHFNVPVEGEMLYRITAHHRRHHKFAGGNYGIMTTWIDHLTKTAL